MRSEETLPEREGLFEARAVRKDSWPTISSRSRRFFPLPMDRLVATCPAWDGAWAEARARGPAVNVRRGPCPNYIDTEKKGDVMNVETVGDVINWSGRFHQSFAHYLPESIAGSEDERAKMLGDYIARHAAELADMMFALNHTEDDTALNTWITEFVNEQPLPDTRFPDSRWEKMAADEILAEVVDMHTELLELYRQLYSRCATTPAAGTLEQMAQMQEHELSQISHSANRLRDM